MVGCPLPRYSRSYQRYTVHERGCCISSQLFFLNIRESSYKNKTLFLDSACRITPQIHSLRDTNSSDQRKNFLSFFPCFRFFLLNIYLKKEEFYFKGSVPLITNPLLFFQHTPFTTGMFALRERRSHVTQEDFQMAAVKVMDKGGQEDMSAKKLWK